MSPLRVVAWLLAALGGIALMILAYRSVRDPMRAAQQRYVLYVAEDRDAKPSQGIPVGVYFLPPEDSIAKLAEAIGVRGSWRGRAFLLNHQEKVILFPRFEQRFTPEMLASGRLPERGKNEVLDVPRASRQDRIAVGNQIVQVVGVLKKQDSLGLSAYYAPDDPLQHSLVDLGGESFRKGFLLSDAELDQIKDVNQLFPHEQYTRVAAVQRLERGTFYTYVGGMALFLIGGSALLIQGYLFHARRITNAWLGPPLAEISRHWKLLSLLHVAYFGVCIVGMLVIYEIPLLQHWLLLQVAGDFLRDSGPLGVVGQAYLSKNILLAAAATLALNFLLGSLLMITVPSLVIPGVGGLVALFRAAVWGILLAPTFLMFARTMLFHSGTILLEGEGYLLATFFAVLVPVYLCSPQAGEKVGNRYANALLMNLKGNLLVFLVLTFAALYEAIEVILQMS
jgi:hypothetical protein